MKPEIHLDYFAIICWVQKLLEAHTNLDIWKSFVLYRLALFNEAFYGGIFLIHCDISRCISHLTTNKNILIFLWTT